MSIACAAVQTTEVKKESAWIVVDSNNFMMGYIMIMTEDNNFNACQPYWSYTAGAIAGKECFIMCNSKEQADLTIAKLEALNQFAGFKNLSWHSEQIDITNCFSPDFSYSPVNQIRFDEIYKTDTKGVHVDIPKGQVTKHKKYYKEICKQFKGARS